MIAASRSGSWRFAPIAASLLVLVASNAGAETVKCQRTIAKLGAAFVQAKAKAFSKCEGAVVKGSIPGPCPDAKATSAVTKAADKMAAGINKACGGDDKICGGDYTNEDLRSTLGWPATCPNFEHGSCLNTIRHCGDIAPCLACIGGAAVDQAMDLYYDDLALPSVATPDLNKCQIAIGKATTAFFIAKSKALQKCWDARLNGKHNLSCEPPSLGDGKYIDAIAKAEVKKRGAICKACGGGDGLCGGGDDFTPAQIGFAATCPAVTIPGGDACGGPITDLDSIVTCVDCVTEFKASCTDRAQVPGLMAYPSECNVCTLPPSTDPCPTTIEFTADGPATELDTGFSGLAHDATVPTNGRLTLSVSGCAGTNQPTCGQCTVSGPLENGGGPAFANHRCADAPWVQCGNDGDCLAASVAGPCVFFFGSPLPLVAGGVPTCIVNRLSAPVAGTVNLDDGSAATQVSLISAVHTTVSSTNPCPICVGGICNDGARIGEACLVTGTGQHGDVSLDCPPIPGAIAGELGVNLNLASATQTKTASAANPACTDAIGKRCLCDTCNNGNADACSTNADCPISGGNPGICGGRRCLDGTNFGGPCNVSSACPGGTCGKPGEGTKPNACVDTTAVVGDGTLCVPTVGNEGECPEGPLTRHCSVETFRTCTADSECQPPPGTCTDCPLGQFCAVVQRPCFPGNGVIGGTVSVDGEPDAPCGGTSLPTLGSFFCVAPVSAGAVNAASGLPGLGRVRIPGSVVVLP